MAVFLVAGAILGILLGLRFKVLVLVPASVLATVVIASSERGNELSVIVLTLVGTLVALQMGYLAGGILRFLGAFVSAWTNALPSLRDGARKSIGGWLKAQDQCTKQDPNVQPHAPIVNVPSITCHPLFHQSGSRCFAPVAIHLGPARDSRLDMIPKCIIGDELVIFVVVSNGVRPRSDQ